MKWNMPDILTQIKQTLYQYRSVLLVITLGLLLLLLPVSEDKMLETEEIESKNTLQSFSVEEFEKKLESALSQISGAGTTKVVLTLKSGQRQILAQDVQRGEGQTVTTAVKLGKGSSQQETVVLQTVAPQFQGALIVCQGGDDPRVRLQISNAVSALTGLGSDCISICKSS